MSRPARITGVDWLGARVLRVVFDDGTVREFDVAGALTGVLSCIDDDEAFSAVLVDEVAGTIAWPGGVDIDPDVLHGDEAPAGALGVPALRAERRLDQTD